MAPFVMDVLAWNGEPVGVQVPFLMAGQLHNVPVTTFEEDLSLLRGYKLSRKALRNALNKTRKLLDTPTTWDMLMAVGTAWLTSDLSTVMRIHWTVDRFEEFLSTQRTKNLGKDG
jgi:hypothetical protein